MKHVNLYSHPLPPIGAILHCYGGRYKIIGYNIAAILFARPLHDHNPYDPFQMCVIDLWRCYAETTTEV